MCDDIFTMRDDRTESYIIFTFANSCMPTLMKIKASTMVCFHKKYIHDISKFYSILSKELDKFQVLYYTLYESDSMLFILIYYKDLIVSLIKKYMDHELFQSYMMACDMVGSKEICYMECLKTLAKRFTLYKTQHMNFPHEVGLLLGYPQYDVEEYIKNQGYNYVLCGYWKVYHNMEEAIATFDLYNRLRAIGILRFYSGRELK